MQRLNLRCCGETNRAALPIGKALKLNAPLVRSSKSSNEIGKERELTLAKFTEGDIQTRLVALQNVQDDPNQWAEVEPDYGKVVEFKEIGTRFLGLLVGRKIVPQPDIANPGTMRDATVYEFMGTDGERYSVWGTYSLDNKLNAVPDGTPILIEYRGEDSFTTDGGLPRRVRRFKVSMPISAESR